MVDNQFDGHYYLTLDDNDENVVLELVWVDGPNYYTRDGGMWLPFNPDIDNPRVWDRVIVDVTPEAAEEFDLAEREDPDNITREQFEDYEILEEDTV